MQFKELGRTGWNVSHLCLGTMTWGTQNTQEEAFDQIEKSLDGGINIVDTAELYPVNPLTRETQGASEQILGNWIAQNSSKRDRFYLATKIAGSGSANVRAGEPITPETIDIAIGASLERLQTDYIDVYQLHWPNRGSYHFRKNWKYDPSNQVPSEVSDNIHAVLEALQKHVDAGRIREVGLSNESAWGTAKFLEISEKHNLPRVAAIQNEYSLMCRLFDTDMSELCCNEDVGLLAYSPLATGLLSGKYSNGALPDGSRGKLNGNLGGRLNPRATDIADRYVGLAKKFGLDPIQMSLAWCATRPFMGSAIFGARAEGQIDTIVAGADLTLSQECIDALDAMHREYPMPY